MKIAKPNADEYAPYYETYISKVNTNDPVKGLRNSKKKLIKLISNLSKKQLNFRYAEGKWTIKEMLVHLIDAERIFTYRALRFARNDDTALPGFDENKFVPVSKAVDRKIKSILREYNAVRNATIALYENMDEEMIMRKGTASEKTMSVRALMYVSLGHEIHHMGMMREKYLGKKKGK